MSFKGLEVLGGQMNFPKLSSVMEDQQYAVNKAHVWLHMLNDGKRPTNWLKANKKGTKVNYDVIRHQSDYDDGLVDLDIYLYEVNTRYGTDLSLNKKSDDSK